MAENLMAGEGVVANAATSVDTHRGNQQTIFQSVDTARQESQAGWQGQGAAAVSQVVDQYMEDSRRIDQALGALHEALVGTDKAYHASEEEAVAGAQKVGSSASSYRGLAMPGA